MKAWATLLTGPDYLVGLRTLHASLRKVGSAYPLVVMVTPDLDARTRQAVTDDGCVLREVAPIQPPQGLSGGYAMERFSQVWTKLAVWGLTEHERVVFVDADMLAVQGMDELFDLDLPAGGMAACHACRCNPRHNPAYPPSWVPENCFYTYCRGAHDTERPDLVDNYLNSGLMVLTPDDAVLEELTRAVAGIEDLSRYPFPEQDLLNERFEGRWRPLSYVYNGLRTMPVQHPSVWRDDEVKNIHYILDKPWTREPGPDGRHEALDQRWWDVAREAGTAPR